MIPRGVFDCIVSGCPAHGSSHAGLYACPGAMTAGPFTITGTQYVFDAYVLCSAPDGTPKWLLGLIGSGKDKSFGIAVDSMGNSYATGFFE